MGNSQIRKHLKHRDTNLDHEKWRELVVFTALLLGAEFDKVHGGWKYRKHGHVFSHRWICARSWLWNVMKMSVCADGSIYQSPGD